MVGKRVYSTGEAARTLGVSQITVKRWLYSGKIRAPKSITGRWRIPEHEVKKLLGGSPVSGNRAVVYARASPGKGAGRLLEEQVGTLTAYCRRRGYVAVEVLREAGSGLNEKRPKLYRAFELLGQGRADVVLAEHKDRLTRFGYKYLEQLAEKLGGRIEVVKRGVKRESADEILKDLISVTTCFTAMMHGARAAKLKRVREAVATAVRPL